MGGETTDTFFSRSVYRTVMDDVKRLEPGTKATDCVFYKSSVRDNRGFWCTFKLGEFYTEGYYQNAWDGKAEMWCKWLQSKGHDV